MIEAKATGGSGVDQRLAAKAIALAMAVGTSRLLARRTDPARWRTPRLLWPLFAKD